MDWMKKLIVVVALIFLLLSYGNYRKQQVLSRVQNYQPNPNAKPKRPRALSYEEMAALKRAKEAESLFQEEANKTASSDSILNLKPSIPDSAQADSVAITDSVEITEVSNLDSTVIDSLIFETLPDSL